MKKSNVSLPIYIILDRHNYVLWVQAMCSFLTGRRLWHYIIGTIVQLVKKDAEKFIDCLKEGDSKNHRIII